VSPAPDDLGDPTSYLTLEKGAPVISSDGERIGRVEEVRADETVDVFDGFVLGTGPLGLDRRYVAADQVDTIFEPGRGARPGRRERARSSPRARGWRR
jgi:hypothetical protein